MRFKLFTGVAVVSALLAPQSVSAQLTLALPLLPCSLSNVSTIATMSVASVNATACGGSFAGNNTGISQPNVLSYIANQGWGTATVLGSSDNLPTFGPFTGNPTTATTLTFDALLSGPFVIALKAGNNFSLYYFLNTPGSAISGVNFTTAGVSVNNGGPNVLSHATLYSVGAGMNVVPEPSTYALMATGMIGLVGFARRRRQA